MRIHGSRALWVVLVGLACATVVRADFNSNAKGTTSANFLKLGVGARADAMGEAYSAVADEATALYWNPGALTRLPAKAGMATLMHAPYVASTFFDYVGFAKNINGDDAWGISAQYFSAGSITETDENGLAHGSFTPYDVALTGGYAHRFEPLSLGVSAKYIQSQLLSSAQTVAIDLGAVSAPLLHDKVRLSAVATNIGGKLKFESESDRLPLAGRLGASCQFTKEWLGSVDLGFPIDNGPYGALGSEYRWTLGHNWTMSARAGLNTRTLKDMNGFSGASFGLGMDFESLGFDYALAPLGDLGLTHRISISFRFLPVAAVLPKHQANLHAPDYPEYHDQQPYFDDSPSLRDRME